MTLLLDFGYFVALLLAWPLLLYKRAKRGGQTPLLEYFGRVPSRRVASRCIWLHGVSLGEINATRTIVAELRKRLPNAAIVISSTTQTGLDRARELYKDLQVFRFPLDFSFAIRTLLHRIRPSLIVLLELETWPNLIEIARQQQIPVLIANGRVTAEKSMRRFNWPIIRTVARRMFRNITWVGAQEQTYAERFTQLGVSPERVHITGSVKYDTAEIADAIPGQDELAANMGIDRGRPLWVCGSTGPGEETEILRAYHVLRREFAGLQLALIPRKPERFDEVARLVVGAGYACLRRSAGPIVPSAPEASPDAPIPVFLGDTLGELRKFYALADAVFVGRTLAPLGGSDLMEIAGLAKPMIVGPHSENFAETAALLRDVGGFVEITQPADLADAVARLLRDPRAARKMGLEARQTIVSRRGATERTVNEILDRIDQ